ncbi:MAG TPA: TonB-dependent receptor plug domain-containing protein, partial [Kofleriaceae bacterium]|nr:TonB-dependent receptor plug domain-containing protein [Kofleriaceae bacterium]
MRRRLLLLPLALLAAAGSGRADEPDGGNLLAGKPDDAAPEPAQTISFEDPLTGYVVVTGVKRRQRTTAALATISIINRDQVQSVPYLYLGDLLAMLPGVDARWGMMQRYYVGLRGLGSTTALNSRALLLWDGVPMNDPFTGELAAGHFVPLVGVERIEVIRGAASTMYGANAFSGVVNVVTRDPTELVPREGSAASLLMGSFLTSRLQAIADQNLGGTHVGASVEGFTTDGPFPRVQRTTPVGMT